MQFESISRIKIGSTHLFHSSPICQIRELRNGHLCAFDYGTHSALDIREVEGIDSNDEKCSAIVRNAIAT